MKRSEVTLQTRWNSNLENFHIGGVIKDLGHHKATSINS